MIDNRCDWCHLKDHPSSDRADRRHLKDDSNPVVTVLLA